MFNLRKLAWKASCVGLTLVGITGTGRLYAAPPEYEIEAPSATETSYIAPSYLTIIDSLIDDAMQDGSITGEERKLILSQARRRLNGTEVAQIESRLSSLPASSSIARTLQADDKPMTAGPGMYSNDFGCCEDEGCGGIFDNLYLFSNAEGWQGPVDDDSNPNNFGLRFGFNAGFALSEDHNIGAQFGMSYGVYNFHGRSGAGGDENSSVEDHLMTTIGIFQRSDLCAPCPHRWNWGIAYDRLYADNIGEEADEIWIGQWRLQLGYALSATDQVGVWTTQGNESDLLKDLGSKVHPLHVYNVYWGHHWCVGADTRFWLGLAEDPGSIVFGASSQYPLTDCLALTGSAQYIHPSSGPGQQTFEPSSGFEEEFWNITVGLAYYPGGTASSKTVAGRRWMPYFNVADNGSFALETNGD